MKKRLLLLLFAAMLMVCSLPVVSFGATPKISINDKAVIYTPYSDYRSGDCILTSSRNMIRRAAILRGSKVWYETTNATLRRDATIFGLLWHNFSHSADGLKYTIKMQRFTGKTEKERIKEFEKIINEHPEGVVVWGKYSSIFGEHGVLLTGVKNGVPYVADSAHNLGAKNYGIEKWTDSTMYSPLRCTQYWYIKQVSLAKGAKAPAAGSPLKPISASKVNTASALNITNATSPSVISQGDGYPVAGIVSSNYRISNVTVSIIDKSGKAVIHKEAKPATWVYDLDNLDSDIKFGILDGGSYNYRVTAKDEKKTATLINAAFTVKPVKLWLAIKNETIPSSLEKGYGFPVRGTVSSGSPISSVKVSIVNSTGKAVISASAEPQVKTYNLKKSDNDVKFGSLIAGSYKYIVTATTGNKTSTLINADFSVTEETAQAKVETINTVKTKKSKLVAKSCNAPKSIKKGKPFVVKGKVTSNKKIKKVTLQVVDSKGKIVLSVSSKNKKKSFNIKKLDPKIKFGKIPKGRYTYKIIAMDTTQTKTVFSKKFVVV